MTSPDDILSNIRYYVSDTANPLRHRQVTLTSAEPAVRQFISSLEHYLRGTGHPHAASPFMTQILDQFPALEAMAQDAAMRAKHFFIAVSGSDLRPPGNDWTIKVCKYV